jgi:hypothetical protein
MKAAAAAAAAATKTTMKVLAVATFCWIAVAAANPTGYFGQNDTNVTATTEYTVWLANHTTSSNNSYARHAFLASLDDPSDGMAVHWTIQEGESMIRLAVAARTTGWLGFGTYCWLLSCCCLFARRKDTT